MADNTSKWGWNKAQERYASGGTASSGIVTPAQDLTKQGVTMPIQAGGASGLPKGSVTPAKVNISKTMNRGGNVKKYDDGGGVQNSGYRPRTPVSQTVRDNQEKQREQNPFNQMSSMGSALAGSSLLGGTSSGGTKQRGGKVKKYEEGGAIPESSIPGVVRHKMNTYETLNSGIPIASGQKDTSQTAAVKRGGKIKGKK